MAHETIPSTINHMWSRAYKESEFGSGEVPILGLWGTLCGYKWEGEHDPRQVFYYEENDICPRCAWLAFPALRGEDPDDPSTWGF